MQDVQPTNDDPADRAFDHHSTDYVEHHIEIFADLRSNCPVAHSPLYGGFYILTRYGDIARAARDDLTFSSAWAEDGVHHGLSIPSRPMRHSFIEMDPPDSSAFRRALLPLFAPASVKARSDARLSIVTEAIDEFIEAGECDVVLDFSDRIPAMTTLDLLGLPTENWREVVNFLHHYTSGPPEGERGVDTRWLIDYIKTEIAERRARPQNDGLTWIVSRHVDDRLMTDDEAIEALFLIMIGGFDTTSALLANTFLFLAEHDDERKRLAAEPDLIPAACEEFLRFYSPVLALGRTVMTDCQIGDQNMRRGDRVLLPWIAANHDPEAFPEPEHVVLDRFPNPHQAFGLGSHRCIGSTLARENFIVGVREFLARIPTYRVLPDRAVRYPSLSANNGWFSMPIEFPPGRRSASSEPARRRPDDQDVARLSDSVTDLDTSQPQRAE